MAETGEALESGVYVAFLAAVMVGVLCLAALFAAFTFAVLHPGDDFDFANGSGHGGDTIVLPAQLF